MNGADSYFHPDKHGSDSPSPPSPSSPRTSRPRRALPAPSQHAGPCSCSCSSKNLLRVLLSVPLGMAPKGQSRPRPRWLSKAHAALPGRREGACLFEYFGSGTNPAPRRKAAISARQWVCFAEKGINNGWGRKAATERLLGHRAAFPMCLLCGPWSRYPRTLLNAELHEATRASCELQECPLPGAVPGIPN